MTARSIRRAQERKAKKLARKAESKLVERPFQAAMTAFEPASQAAEHLCCEPEPVSPATISEAQLAANRANAQLSTGPTSEAGKAKSSLNAVKAGLTGRTVLLPTDDAAEYQRHIEAYENEFQPVGQRERDLVQSIADTQWRLLRIPSLESGIYALGHLEFVKSVDDHEAVLRPGMIEVKTFLKYERQLRNLQLQESRLSRRHDKELAELRALQLERQRKEAKDLEKVGQALSPGLSNKSRPAANGFVFSTAPIGSPASCLAPAHIVLDTEPGSVSDLS